jgi:hypothetical protein
VPQIAVRHLVPAFRLDQRWFLKRFFWQGVSDAVMHLIEQAPSSSSKRLRLALERCGSILGSPRDLQALLFPTQRPEVFRSKCFSLIDIGFIFGMLGIARH